MSMYFAYVDDILVGEGLMRLIVLCVFEQNFVHVSGGILIQFVGGTEDDQGDFAIA